jgi:hypothetical protein
VPQRLAAGLGLVVLSALVVLVAQAPTDPYFADSLQAWEQGRFVRFHGLAQWVGWLWPYAAMAWLLARTGRRDLRWRAQGFPGRSPTIGRHELLQAPHLLLPQPAQNGEACCAEQGAQAGFDHCKARIKAAGLAGPGGVRVNKAGCLDRCAGGPVAVVYPDETWYTYVDQPTSTRSSNRT